MAKDQDYVQRSARAITVLVGLSASVAYLNSIEKAGYHTRVTGQYYAAAARHSPKSIEACIMVDNKTCFRPGTALLQHRFTSLLKEARI